MARKPTPLKTVEALRHEEATRKNIPTAEYQSVLQKETQDPVRVAYERRNRDLDPQLVWRGKDEQDWSDLVVHAPPLYIQEKVHPKALSDDLLRETKEQEPEAQLDLFAQFNGIPEGADRTDFYQHDQNRIRHRDPPTSRRGRKQRRGISSRSPVGLPGVRPHR